MRILMVSEDIPAEAMGGLGRHVLALTRALAADGHQVDLMGNDDAPSAALEAELPSDSQFYPELHGQFEGWKEMSLGLFMPPKRHILARRFAQAMLRRGHGYEVIHYHGHLPNVARHIPAQVNFIQTRHDQGSDCLIHTRFRRGAICTEISPQHCAGCRSWQPNLLQTYITSLAVKHFRQEVMQGFKRHKTVFVSDLLQRNLERSFGAGPWGVTIHNFIDAAELSSARSKATHQPALPFAALRVFIAAKLYPAKGVESLLTALMPRMETALHITVAGDGADEAHLRQCFPQVNFLGWQSSADTLRMTARADAVVVPSVCEEACPSTVLEALLLGKTVFALRLGGTPELASYASGPDQLRLHDSMAELAKALRAFRPRADYPQPAATAAHASQAAGRLLALYRLPPGAIATS